MSSAVEPAIARRAGLKPGSDTERGLVLGRYRPLRPLGSGGSGSVWLARDEQTGVEIALKVVPKEGKAAPRAEREAEAAARLRHPHCLRAYGLESDDRHVYIAYEYVPGSTLRQALRSGELGDEGAVEAAAQVLEALSFAHARGIVHRDVKPSNVLLADEETVSVRLFDFGLAQLADAETLTGAGDVPGTLAYISPERLRGEAAGPAADVWAVGVFLWEALAGHHPFWRASPLETGEVIQAGAPSLREARPDLPERLVAAVDRALSIDPARRPSAAGLARALRGGGRERARKRRPAPRLRLDPRRLAAASSPPALAALVAGWTAFELPFYPERSPALLAAAAAALTGARPRLGLAFALAVPVMPLGNMSLGLAMVYCTLAVAWLALVWRDPKCGLLFAVGPLLAPLGLLALVPIAVSSARASVRRAAHALAAVLVAGVVAGVRGDALPFGGGRTGALDLAASAHPLRVGEALGRALLDTPVLGLEALVLATAAAALPLARRGGDAALAGFGAALLAGTLLAAPGATALPLVAAGWTTCVVLAVQTRLRNGQAVRSHTLGTVWSQTRAFFHGRLKPGGGLGWPQRIGHVRGR